MQAVAAWFAVEKGADERIIEKDEIEIIDDEQGNNFCSYIALIFNSIII